MFGKSKERTTTNALEEATAHWNQRVEAYQSLIAVIDGSHVLETNGLLLKPGEVLLGQVQNVGLIQERRIGGHWQGSSQGFSIPIGSIKGRSVRYRVGATHGHYVQGEPQATAVDHGTLSITNQRVVYQGATKTAECLFTKLLGVQQSGGSIIISVSNRQAPTVVHVGDSLEEWVADRISIATSLYQGEKEQVLANLHEQLNEVVASKPSP